MSLAWFWSLLLIGGTVLLSIAGTLIVRRLVGVEVLERHNEVAGIIYAVLGVVAAAGVIAASLFHIAWADGLASIAIGLLLASVAFVLANETRSLIAGEAVAPIVMERLKEARARIGCITSLDEVATLHLGPGQDSGGAYSCLAPRFHDRRDRRGDPRGHRGTSSEGA
jgi:Co/Zn/Cd efflux system component